MTTITATELRKNLDDVLARVERGQEIVVKHRFYKPVRLVREESTLARSRHAGLERIMQLHKTGKVKFGYDVEKPLKELYADSIAKKYDIN